MNRGLTVLNVTKNFIRFGSQICCRLQANDCLSTAESKHFMWSGLGIKFSFFSSSGFSRPPPHHCKKYDM